MDDVTVVLHHGDAASRPPIRLSWSRHDPLAVRVEIVGLALEPWVVLRDILRAGLTQPTGIGRVRIGPVGLDAALTLQEVGRLFVARLPADQLRDFLAATEAIVPAGSEACGDSLDAALDAMLNRP